MQNAPRGALEAHVSRCGQVGTRLNALLLVRSIGEGRSEWYPQGSRGSSRGKDLERSQKAIPGNLSDNSISSRAHQRNLFTALIMVFCRPGRRLSCFCATVNGLTTNRQDLHRITNAFTTNLFVCDQSASDAQSLSLSPSLPSHRQYRRLFVFLRYQLRTSLTLPCSLCPVASGAISAKISGPERVLWRAIGPVCFGLPSPVC